MSRIVYINGEFLPIEKAFIPVMDRGFLFADGVYEVSAVVNESLIDNDAHLARLKRSLSELKIPIPESSENIIKNQIELIKRNNLKEGLVYIQITRGVAERDFSYANNMKPTFVMFTQEKNILNNPNAKTGVKVITMPEIRWQRRDIKSTALLAQVMAKSEAHHKGVFEAWLVENGHITEGSSSNAFIIKNNVIITKNLSNEILPGITRKAILKLAKDHGIKIEERNFAVAEAYAADEAFLTSASNFVIGIVEIDGKKVGDGKVGRITSKVLEYYIQEAIENLFIN